MKVALYEVPTVRPVAEESEESDPDDPEDEDTGVEAAGGLAELAATGAAGLLAEVAATGAAAFAGPEEEGKPGVSCGLLASPSPPDSSPPDSPTLPDLDSSPSPADSPTVPDSIGDTVIVWVTVTGAVH